MLSLSRIYLFVFLCLPLLMTAQNNKKVLIIGIDGCRPDALHRANTPNIDSLISTGIFSPDALNEDVTSSGPGWSAILCGVWSEKHLVTSNNFSGNDYENYPPLFKYIEDYDPALNTLSICHWSPINDNIVLDHADFKLNVSTDQAVADQAAAYISANNPDVIFLHFDDVDHAGHAYGYSTTVDEYVSSIEVVDTQIGIVLEAIENRENYEEEDWLVICTTDHGGLGNSHGGNSIGERNVFLIASGKSYDPKLITKDSTLSGGAFDCLGIPLHLDFDGVNDNIRVNHDELFDFGATQDFTVECRVRTDNPGDVAIVGNKDWDSGYYKGFVFSFKLPAGPEWKVNIGDGNNRADINTGGAIGNNEWYTLSVSFDRDGFMKMYQDGVLLDSLDISEIGDINTGEGLFFGTDINEAYDYTGAISEVRIWKGIITGQTLGNWYCTSIDDNHPNKMDLVGYWKLDEGTESLQAFDYSGNENYGIINGPTWVNEDSMLVYDYSKTPRLTDIVPTLFEHLCIPIEEEWSLDGKSLIPECQMTNAESIDKSRNFPEFKINPNPVLNGKLNVFFGKERARVQSYTIYSSDGSQVISSKFSGSGDFSIDVEHLKPGYYILALNFKMEANNQHRPFIIK